MTQNEVSIIKNSVIDATEAYVEARLAVADFMKTQIGVVVSATKKNKKWVHTVRCNATSSSSGIVYDNVLSINNIHFEDTSVVFVLAPNAQFSNQFILGKLDNVPYDIVAGSIKIGGTEENPNFSVDSSGNVSIKYGSINIGDGQFIVNTNGVVTCENINANGGTIAGFKITNGKIGTESGNAAFAEYHIGCGLAGRGIVNMVGANGNAYIQISNSGDPNTCLDGIRIYQGGKVVKYNGSGAQQWDLYLSNLPAKHIYEDTSTGYLRWS